MFRIIYESGNTQKALMEGPDTMGWDEMHALAKKCAERYPDDMVAYGYDDVPACRVIVRWGGKTTTDGERRFWRAGNDGWRVIENHGTVDWKGETLTLMEEPAIDNDEVRGEYTAVWGAHASDDDGGEVFVEWEYNPFGYSEEEIQDMAPDCSGLGDWANPIKIVSAY